MTRKLIISTLFSIVLIISFQLLNPVSALTQPSSDEKLLGVVVNAYGDSIAVTGYCIYVKDGKEIERELEKDNAWGWSFRGEYIKEVKMQKVSGDASYELFVMEGDEMVFQSERTSSTDPIIYKRK
ncbi:MAG: hypothetical protein B6D63_01820 [Candidatus Latescibacteria bacterium 4484_7]|nr:MAG: hypothetical protein B6D63_01820 [Candidatus Latescibacteria bacterium 4484_7]